MRAIERTTQFKRDFKRETERPAPSETGSRSDNRAAGAHQRHAAWGEIPGPSSVGRVVRLPRLPHQARPCLTYEKPDASTLRLIWPGSHSELGWSTGHETGATGVLPRHPARALSRDAPMEAK